MRFKQLAGLLFLCIAFIFPGGCDAQSADPIAEIQAEAIANNQSSVAHWGTDPADYTQWRTHSNRLVPVYTFGTRQAGPGVSLSSYTGANSVYRDKSALTAIYGYLPEATHNPAADYMDQTDIYRLQRAAIDSGKKHIFLVVFDGMDWQITRAAAIARTGNIYTHGKGLGLFFQAYDANGTAEYGHMVTSPADDDKASDVDTQTPGPAGKQGGYDADIAGDKPWSTPTDPNYLLGKMEQRPHLYVDSAASATAMTSGIKTYNNAVNVRSSGSDAPAESIAHQAQQSGYRVGAVSSVPISHATTAAAYAHNVSRHDYQDISRDLLGLPSVSHPGKPLPGLDVLIGTGIGIPTDNGDSRQGSNLSPTGKYLAAEDLQTLERDGRYIVQLRTADADGGDALMQAARRAADENKRLFGYFGTQYKHLPYATANGDYKPVPSVKNILESYSQADLLENPTLAEMTEAAIIALHGDDQPFWLMVEPGDVDWAAHNANLDSTIGAVYSGEAAVRVIAEWVDANSNWDESLLIVTADHGHHLVVTDPAALHK